MTTFTRRTFAENALKGSVLTLTYTVGGAKLLLTPEEARAQQIPLRKLTPSQARDLEILGEAILPGARNAGLVNFVDHQLTIDPDNTLLVAKYFHVPLPYDAFYANGLKVAGDMAKQARGKALEKLAPAQLKTLVQNMATPDTVVDGYPIFLFYMCLRLDAVDVVYGTPAGFKKLNIPYMAHIMPPEGWNG